MTYRLIACDLDETLLTSNHHVAEVNRAAIKRAREEYGIQFVPTTGRGYRSVQETLKELNLFDLADEYVISFNGGAITENQGPRVLQFFGLTFEKAEELFTFGLTQDVCIHVHTQTDMYLFNLTPEEKERMDKNVVPYQAPTENSIDFLRGQQIAKVLYQNMDTDYLRSLEPILAPVTAGHAEVNFSSNRYMEFNGLGSSKGRAVTTLAEKLGIPLSEVIAVGDNYNDMTMLEVAGLSVVAQNGVPAAKAIADYVTTANHNEGVVAELLEKYIFAD